ncbi:thioredoxin [Haloferax elongans ATCC BAA-1513]|uniref:Thioredoxin n=1 Tax=Haloferax elongans ATCC BAA-1513 TaxID=1230453 RepID=M0HWZ4_HALEO|nr:TlpA disulfide reductase family protein [Haloferax elongans]ELZ87644.1 thioredoxin [Haloferax elongans ATCC BAA-1513]
MRRRDLLAGLAGAATLGAGAYAVGGTTGLGSGPRGVEPVALTAIEAPRSHGETLTVPERGRVTLVEFFATWCDVCAASMAPLGEAYDRVGDDVQFVSVTNEPLGHAVTRAEIREWWVEHDGTWPVAPDEDLALTEALGASAVPMVVVLDADNVVTWSAKGKHSAETLVSRIEEARGGNDD